MVAGDQLVADAHARIGQTLGGRWRLEAVLGLGGMAAVYAARHRAGARVAIKMLHQRFSGDREVCRRFRREAYLANAVGHPSVVVISDDDCAEDGTPFFVMELLEGESVEALRQRAGGRVDVATAARIALATLDVLAVAHDKGIVHRDLKPSNLFLTHAGEVKVLDFGVAGCTRSLSGDSAATRPGTLLGTPAFMAPEQARSRSRRGARPHRRAA